VSRIDASPLWRNASAANQRDQSPDVEADRRLGQLQVFDEGFVNQFVAGRMIAGQGENERRSCEIDFEIEAKQKKVDENSDGMNLNSSVCRPGNPARYRAVENAPSPDEAL
jgi:hypothetical protein